MKNDLTRLGQFKSTAVDLYNSTRSSSSDAKNCEGMIIWICNFYASTGAGGIVFGLSVRPFVRACVCVCLFRMFVNTISPKCMDRFSQNFQQ